MDNAKLTALQTVKNERSGIYGRWSGLFRGRMSKTDL